MKSFFKFMAKISLFILLMVMILIGGFIYVTEYKITGIDTSVSPDGRYELFFENVGEPDWPFGHSHARLVLKRGDKKIKDIKFDVANDGAVLYDSNWSVEWKDDSVVATINGEEQEDRSYTFELEIPEE